MTEVNWWALMSRHWGKVLGGLFGLIFAILVICLNSFWWAVFIYFCVSGGVLIGWRLDVSKGLRHWLGRLFNPRDEF